MKPQRREPLPFQESVWDYPRPPRLESFSGHIEVVSNKRIVATTKRALRLLEQSHPPWYYIPHSDVKDCYLIPSQRISLCEWKGMANFYHLAVDDKRIQDGAWCYLDPPPPYHLVQGYIGFYAHLMDGCYIDGEQVVPQPGDFYGGWITKNICGPFKGEPGTGFW